MNAYCLHIFLCLRLNKMGGIILFEHLRIRPRNSVQHSDDYGFEMMQLKELEMLLLQKDLSHSHSQPFSQTSRALSQNLKDTRWGIRKNLLYSLQDNWKRIWILTLWFMIMAGLFMWKCVQYKRKDAFHVMGYCLVVAKGAAETLKFNMALILLPVCRNTITYLRSTALSYSVPFDDSINFHKVN